MKEPSLNSLKRLLDVQYSDGKEDILTVLMVLLAISIDTTIGQC